MEDWGTGTHLLVQLDTLHDLQSQGKVAEKAVDPQEADETEVAEHSIEGTGAVFSNDLTETNVQYVGTGSLL